MIGQTSTREFSTKGIAESAADLARVMGYEPVIVTKVHNGLWTVTATHTPEADKRFKDHMEGR